MRVRIRIYSFVCAVDSLVLLCFFCTLHIASAYRRRVSDAFLRLDRYSVHMKDPWPPQRVSAVTCLGTFDLIAAFA